MLPSKVLLVDDEPGPRFGVRRFLKSRGFEVEEAGDCATAKTQLRAFAPDVAILDFRLPDGTALDLIPFIRANSATSIIVLTAYATIDTAVGAVKMGAEPILTKPVELQTLLVVIERLLEDQRNRRQVLAGTKRGELPEPGDPFLGKQPPVRDLPPWGGEQTSRQDLYYRIGALDLSVPPLRERRDDIPAVAETLLERLSRDLGHPPVTFGSDALDALRRYRWPGNIRELRNVLERALLRTVGNVLDARTFEFPSGAFSAPPATPTTVRTGTLDDVERDYIEQVLLEENGAIDRVAERLGVSRSAVYYKARKHGIDIAKARS